MKLTLITSALLLAGFQGLPPLVGPLIPDTMGLVTGVVQRADTGKPLSEAQVAVIVPGEAIAQAMSRAVISDLEGRFTIRDVAPGEYSVVARHEGYFSLSGDAFVSTPADRGIAVGEGQRVNAGVLELIPGAAISGRISGDDARPLTAATVEALEPAYVQGRLTFKPVKTTKTDDRGDYRLFWLPPGEYYVRGYFRAATADRPERYERVFFPGIVEEDAAAPVFVSAGSEMSAIDFQVSTIPIAGVTISGRVAAAGQDASGIRVRAVYAVPQGRRVVLVHDDADLFQNQAADSSGGQFVIRNVPPGKYDLYPLVQVGDGEPRTVRIPVDAAGNVQNVSAVLEPQREVRGHVTLDGEMPGDRVSSNALLLTTIGGLPELSIRETQAAFTGVDTVAAVATDPDTGEFAVSGMSPGRYAFRLSSSFQLPDVYIEDVKQEETSVFDSGFTVGDEVSPALEVTLKSRGGVISGTVLDPTRLSPFAHATVVLIPELTRRQNPALYQHMTSASDGTFTFTGTAPGTYKLFAWESVTPGAWENAVFLARYENRGVAVRVLEGSGNNVQLTVIP